MEFLKSLRAIYCCLHKHSTLSLKIQNHCFCYFCWQVELLEITWEHLARADRITPPALIKERFCNRLENKDYGSAISCLVSHPVSGSPEFSRNAWLKFFKENSQHFGQDTLIRLLHEASSSLTTRNGSPYPVLQNLISSCKDFLRTQSPAPVADLTGTPLYSSI